MNKPIIELTNKEVIVYTDNTEVYRSILRNYNKNPMERLKDLHDLTVPIVGSGRSKGSEIVRLTVKVVYRYYNDGDRVGNRSSTDVNRAYQDLKKLINSYCHMPSMSELRSYTTCEYTDWLDELAFSVADFLLANPEKLFKKRHILDLDRK